MPTVTVKRTTVTTNLNGTTTTTIEVTTKDGDSSKEALHEANEELADVEKQMDSMMAEAEQQIEEGFASFDQKFKNMFDRWPFKPRKRPEPPKKT